MVDWDEFFDSTLVRGGGGTASSQSDRSSPTFRTVVALPRDPAVVDLWRRGTGRLCALQNEHLLPLVSYRIDRDEWCVEHRSRDGMLAAAEWFPADALVTAGHVVTLGSALARGLAALHQSGICRDGALSLADVVIDREGRPAWKFDFAVPQSEGAFANDVCALAQLLRDTLSQRAAPGALTLTLLRAEDHDPRRRPTAVQLSESLLSACNATALAWPPMVDMTSEANPPDIFAERTSTSTALHEDFWPTDSSQRVLNRARRQIMPYWLSASRWRVVVIGGVGLLVAIGVTRGMNSQASAGELVPSPAALAASQAVQTPVPRLADSVVEVTTDPPDEPQQTTTTVASPTIFRGPEIPWSAVLSSLDATRSRAFVNGAIEQLAKVDAPDSAALKSDQAALSTLRAAGLTPRGLSVDLVSVTEVSRSADSVKLRVVDRASAYDLVDSAGAVDEHHAARGDTAWAITLVAGSSLGAWRIAEVLPETQSENTAR